MVYVLQSINYLIIVTIQIQHTFNKRLNFLHIILYDWSIPKPLINDKLTNLFLDCVLLNGFEQIIDVATRSSNILDLVLCRNLNMVPEVHIKHPLVDSDHEAIEFTLSYTNFKSNMYDNNAINYKRNFQKINVESILNYFKNIN